MTNEDINAVLQASATLYAHLRPSLSVHEVAEDLAIRFAMKMREKIVIIANEKVVEKDLK